MILTAITSWSARSLQRKSRSGRVALDKVLTVPIGRLGGDVPRPAPARRQVALMNTHRNDSLSSLLPGTWLLKSRIDVTATGEKYPDTLLGEDPVALLIYDTSGHFSAQFMKRDRSGVSPEVAGSASNNTRAQGGYDAYFGTYSVDDTTSTVTQRLLGAISPTNVGMTLSRAMSVRGDTLVIELETTAADGTPVTRTLTWGRLSGAA